MKRVVGAALLSLALLVSTAAAGTEEEIAHLLAYIGQSDCIFIRNGKEHDSAEGLEHIRMKYDHVKKRVDSAEDFIAYAASKSSLTGKIYRVRCGVEETATGEWLRAELERLRQP